MSRELDRIVPIILSGGSGSRLWPLSRESHPKQLLPLVTGQTMIQDTASRVADPAIFAAPVVVTAVDQRFIVGEQLRAIGKREADILLEPIARNTAPAVGVAALHVARTNPKAVMLILAADHAIRDVGAFHRAIAVAAQAARAGQLVTFGIKPERPETGYGYIEADGPLPGHDGVMKIARFVEKPDLKTAEAYVAGGKHHWNSGMFVFTAETYLRELERLAPGILAACREAMTGAELDRDFIRLNLEGFAKAPSISIDYAVMEKTASAAVVPADIGWSDVGAWSALWDIGSKDQAGNVTHGDAMALNASGCYVRSEGPFTAVVGMEDTVVVSTSDAVIVVPRNRAQDVKLLVEKLKSQGRREINMPRRVYKPWGFYESLLEGNNFQVKRLMLKPGAAISLQKHFHRAEHWVVVTGTANVECGDREVLVRENESIFIPQGEIHRASNPGRIPLELIEVQSGHYLGEDDIVRYEDRYGRTPAKPIPADEV